jgi:hypothetical protein
MMRHRGAFRRLLRTAAVLICAAAVSACGGGGYAEVVIADDGPPPVALLEIALTRVGPEAIEIDWSDDPYVDRFIVRRDGHALANVNATTLIDASVYVDERYCYQVSGYDPSGLLVAASDTACMVLLP